MIDDVFQSVATYKTEYALHKIKEVASSLKPNSKILILGAGQGAETIIFKRFCPSSYITAVDRWFGEGWSNNGYLNHWSENTESGFIDNCNKFDASLQEVHCFDVFKSKRLDDLHESWDLIYYDCNDNTNGDEFDMIMKMLRKLWNKLNVGGILMGDDYTFNKPDFKMTPIVDEFIIELKEPFAFDADTRNKSFYWMVKKND